MLIVEEKACVLDCISQIHHIFKEIFKFNILIILGIFCVCDFSPRLLDSHCACFPSLTQTALSLHAYGLRKTSFDCAHTNILWDDELPTLSNMCVMLVQLCEISFWSLTLPYEWCLSDKTMTFIYKTKQNKYHYILKSPLNQNWHFLWFHGILQCLL